jgi:radical SAM protein with 4Fe4S-binding SPASM domain
MLNYIKKKVYRYKYINAPKLNHTAPVDISLELSSFCTNTCGYCYHADPKKLPFVRGKMTSELADKIIYEAADLGINSIKFNYRGESTMNPIFENVTALAKRLAKGMTFIDRITNSNFNFDPNREDLFRGLCNQTKVKVSFDSFRKEIFEKQRKGSDFEKTLFNMRKFYNYKGRDNEMVIQAVRTLLNKDEDLRGEIKKRFPSATVSIRDCVGGRTDKNLSSVLLKDRDPSNRISCIQAHARLMINYDGTVQVCCPDITNKLIIGDCKFETISQIWNSDKAKEIRKSLLNKTAFEKSPCKNCSSYESYAGYKPPKES